MLMPFWIALQFLTVIPIQLKSMPSARQNALSCLYYPLVGIIIGLLLFAMASLLHALPTMMLSSLILVLWIWLSGGLHLDGLADTADAWVGGFGDRERTLKIMKDPACGPIGVLSLVMVCVLKWSAIYMLLQQSNLLALILFPMLGRMVPLYLFLSTPYVRAQGLGSAMAHAIPKMTAIMICVIGLSLFGYFSWVGVGCVIISILELIYLRHVFVQRIGGITGDTVGAAIELTETLSMLAFVILAVYLPLS